MALKWIVAAMLDAYESSSLFHMTAEDEEHEAGTNRGEGDQDGANEGATPDGEADRYQTNKDEADADERDECCLLREPMQTLLDLLARLLLGATCLLCTTFSCRAPTP